MDTDVVYSVMRAVRRADFLPIQARPLAAADRALPIGHGQTNSQPTTVANMLRLLDVRPEMRVLDVGSGSGWTSALLGHLVGPQGAVVGVELIPELAAWGAANVQKYELPWVRIQLADPEVLGWPADAPYDRILVSAGAARIRDELVAQLAEGGVLVVPVKGRMLRVVKHADGSTDVTRHGEYAFVPLRG